MDPVTLGLARVAATKISGPALRDLAVPIGTKALPPVGGNGGNSPAGLSDGTVLGGTSKYAHVAVRTCYGIQLAYSNFYAGASNTEVDTPNNITVRAAVEPTGNIIIPVTFNGARTIVIEPGCTVLSDPVGVNFVKGQTFYSRTWVQVAAAGKFPLAFYAVASAGEGHNYSNPVGADLTATGSASLTGLNPNTYAYAPSMILGKVIDPGKPVIGIVGDSIATGTGDTGGLGYYQRALNGNYSFQKVSSPGEAMLSWSGNNGLTRYRRMGVLLRAGVTHIVTDYTVNSLAITTIQQDAVTMWGQLAAFGVPIYQSTLTPQTTSTDVWATVGNQTLIKTGAEETRRIDFNTWLRAGAPIVANTPVAPGTVGALVAGKTGHPLTGVIDVAVLAESTLNSGRWKNSYTSDGTHPNATGATALAASLNPATLFGQPSVT